MAMRTIKESTAVTTAYTGWVSDSIGVTNRKSIGLFLAFDWTDTEHTITLKFESEDDEGNWYDINGVTSGTASLDTVTTPTINGSTADLTISVDVQHHEEIRVRALVSTASSTATKMAAKVFYGDLTV